MENDEKFRLLLESFKNMCLKLAVLSILVTGLSRTEASKFADDTQGFRILKAEWRESQKYLLIPKNKIKAEIWSSQI